MDRLGETSNHSFSITNVTANDVCVGDLCLFGGDATSGNLYIRGKPVCDDSWSITNAKVVCREMGFIRAVRATKQSE